MATRFVVPTGGLTSGPGTSLATALTLAFATSSTGPVVAGDTVKVVAGTYEVVVSGATGDQMTQLLVRTSTTGTAAAPILWQGCNAAGVVDGTGPKVKAVGTWSTAVSMFSVGTDAGGNPLAHCVWMYWDWDANDLSYNAWNNGGLTGTGAGTNFNAYPHMFYWCTFQKSKHNGFSGFGGASGSEAPFSFWFIGCRFYGCGVVSGGRAAIARGSLQASWVMIGCVVEANQGGINVPTATSLPFVAIGCVFRDNLTDAAGLNSGSTVLLVLGCTFDGGQNAGLYCSPTPARSLVANNIFSNNGTVGVVDTVWANTSPVSPYRNCCTSGNTTAAFDESNSGSGTVTDLPGDGHITTAPAYQGMDDTVSDPRTVARNACNNAGMHSWYSLAMSLAGQASAVDARPDIGVGGVPVRRANRGRGLSL